MNPLFRKLYKHKKTRTRDPNAPPPPNLFSTVRDLKNTRTVVDNNSQQIRDLENRIERLENQNRYLQGVVNLLQNHLTKR